MSDAAKVFGMSVVGAAFGVYIFFNGFKHLREKQLIQNTPTSKIRSIAMGPVEIFGKTVKKKNSDIISPFSGKSCVWCRYTVEEYRSNGKSSSWHTIVDETKKDLFYLEDNTGSVLVDPEFAEVEIPVRYEEESSLFGKKLTARTLSFLESRKISKMKTLRVREYYLLPGEETYIYGTAGDNPYTKAKAKNEENIMIQKGKNEKFFYISNKAEKDVLKRYDFIIYGGLIGGSVLILGCLALIFLILEIL